MLLRNDMILCNTLFPHKMTHRVTWESPLNRQEQKDKHGNIRKNPYRNQIDYMMMRGTHRKFVEDARSYNGIETYTDHRDWLRQKLISNGSFLANEKLQENTNVRHTQIKKT